MTLHLVRTSSVDISRDLDLYVNGFIDVHFYFMSCTFGFLDIWIVCIYTCYNSYYFDTSTHIIMCLYFNLCMHVLYIYIYIYIYHMYVDGLMPSELA